MKLAYPIYIAKNGSDYLVYVPDLDIFTEGKGAADAMSMARDAISGKALEYEEEGRTLPEPSDYKKARILTMQRADGEDFLYSNGICTLVDTDLEEYQRKMENRSVKKNCTIPYRLSVEADKAGLNYSRVLQNALREELHMG